MLLVMLMSATIFEGYDVTIFHLCTPDIARTFHMGDRGVGLMASTVRFGMMLSFFVLAFADRIGRKPLIANTVFAYTLFTLCTALSTGVIAFVFFQSCSQIFLSAEFAIAVVMISEEFPDHLRGRGVAILNMVGLLGVIAAGSLYGYVAESRWGWRGMYLIGIAPLLLVAFLRRGLRETARFTAIEQSGALEARLDFRGQVRRMLAPFGGRHRSRLLLVAALWNCWGLVNAPAVTFFSLYAKRDHHWTSGQIGRAIVIAYIFGTLGHLLSGYGLDRIGRKATTAIFYLCGAVAMLILFQTSSHQVMLLAMIATVFASSGGRTATATYSVELFPTEIRATSYSLTVQVLGQVAPLLTPLIVGSLSTVMGGLGNAIAVVCIGPVVGAILVWLFAPETRGCSLDEPFPQASADVPAQAADG
jgi:MFS family permease